MENHIKEQQLGTLQRPDQLSLLVVQPVPAAALQFAYVVGIWLQRLPAKKPLQVLLGLPLRLTLRGC
jgi:hypothetical protein